MQSLGCKKPKQTRTYGRNSNKFPSSKGGQAPPTPSCRTSSLSRNSCDWLAGHMFCFLETTWWRWGETVSSEGLGLCLAHLCLPHKGEGRFWLSLHDRERQDKRRQEKCGLETGDTQGNPCRHYTKARTDVLNHTHTINSIIFCNLGVGGLIIIEKNMYLKELNQSALGG